MDIFFNSHYPSTHLELLNMPEGSLELVSELRINFARIGFGIDKIRNLPIIKPSSCKTNITNTIFWILSFFYPILDWSVRRQSQRLDRTLNRLAHQPYKWANGKQMRRWQSLWIFIVSTDIDSLNNRHFVDKTRKQFSTGSQNYFERPFTQFSWAFCSTLATWILKEASCSTISFFNDSFCSLKKFDQLLLYFNFYNYCHHYKVMSLLTNSAKLNTKYSLQ